MFLVLHDSNEIVNLFYFIFLCDASYEFSVKKGKCRLGLWCHVVQVLCMRIKIVALNANVIAQYCHLYI